MSEMRVHSCDGCNEMAPPDYCHSFPKDGWIAIQGSYDYDDDTGERTRLDACSWECLATIVAARIASGVEL